MVVGNTLAYRNKSTLSTEKNVNSKGPTLPKIGLKNALMESSHERQTQAYFFTMMHF